MSIRALSWAKYSLSSAATLLVTMLHPSSPGHTDEDLRSPPIPSVFLFIDIQALYCSSSRWPIVSFMRGLRLGILVANRPRFGCQRDLEEPRDACGCLKEPTVVELGVYVHKQEHESKALSFLSYSGKILGGA